VLWVCCGCAGRVLLLTNPVVGGYVQNPISVYYCFNAGSSDKLEKCIAEVGTAGQQQQQQQHKHSPCIS
jgi:DUF1365 family protein